MRYASVCSGVEAASLAWEHMGWEPVFFSEIDKFPSAVLAERYPGVTNMGDMTRIKVKENGDIWYGSTGVQFYDGPVDLLVGGTPCQSFSVAGKREGLRGVSGLALDFVRLAYELAAYRGLRWLIWENVPGVFSSAKGADFATFLSGLAGWDVTTPPRGWGNAGIIPNATDGNFGLAFRTLDAQYVRVEHGFPGAIPQRRRRVFVVGCLGDWGGAAKVLFDAQSMYGDAPPRRKAFKATAAGTGDGAEMAIGIDGYNQSVTGDVCMSVSASASDAHHVPCLITNSNGGQVMPTITTEMAHQTGHQLERGGGIWWNGEHVAQTLTRRMNDARMPDKNNFFGVIQMNEKAKIYDARGNGDGGG